MDDAAARREAMTLPDRIEAAGGASRELDAEINDLIFPHNCRNTIWDCGQPLHYTSSLDAAMSLVPEGCGVTISRYWNKVGEAWSAELAFGGLPDDPRRVFDCYDAATPALALTAAALRAISEVGK